MSKEALIKQMDAIKLNYDSQINSLDVQNDVDSPNANQNSTAVVMNGIKPKSGGKLNNRKVSGLKKGANSATNQPNNGDLSAQNSFINSDANNESISNSGDPIDPEQRLLKLQGMVVGGEQANNEELKKKRNKKKKYAEERKKLLAESLRNGDDEEFMLSVYDSVQEEVKYKTKMLDKEKEQVKFLKNEVSDLQREFEKEREEYLDTIRKQERQLKLLYKITQKLQPIIPHDCSYFNLDKIQGAAIWNEELQDWILPDLKRERLALPTMGHDLNSSNSKN